jgi:hypothetical protein
VSPTLWSIFEVFTDLGRQCALQMRWDHVIGEKWMFVLTIKG